jgi:adenosylhomocysteine nucleosidase
VPRIGILTGLKREAACLAPLENAPEAPLVRLSAVRADGAQAAAEELVAGGAVGLVSFGTAGGLDPTLPPGAVVLPEAVIGGGGGWPVDAGWRAALADVTSTSVLVDRVAGVDVVVATPSAKATLFGETRAAVCDMESHAVARAATAAGLPFVVIRAVSDTAAACLPPWAACLATDDGALSWRRTTAGMLAHPADWPAMIRLGRESRAALTALRRLVAAAGPLLGLPRL